MEIIGDLSEVRGETIIEWKVKDFFSLRDAIDTRYDSAEFHFSGISWNLWLYPNGETSRGSHGWIGLYLIRKSPGSAVTLDCSLGLKCTDRNEDHFVRSTAVAFHKHNCGKGWSKFMFRSVLMARKDDLVPLDEMTIICTLKESAPVNLVPTTATEGKYAQTETHMNINVSMESLSKDLSELLNLSSNHDVEIKCGEFSMKAHKIILGARSEVFKAMLQSDMMEGQTGVVEIQDIESLYIQDFVKYIYTGSMPEMTFDKAKALYEAGDKYAVRSLVLRCSDYLQDNLSPDIACQCLALADGHSDEELKNKVTTYILDEKLYLQDELWLPFCENYPRLANEVYRLSQKATLNNNIHFKLWRCTSFFETPRNADSGIRCRGFVSWINNSVRCSSGPEKRSRIKSGYQEIWRHEAGKLLGASLKFDIIIHSKLLKKDECVQTASYLNADLSVESLPKDFSEMFDSGLNHDAEIRCGEHSVKAHKNVLCARSEVLKAMLESDMVEGRTGIVELQDTDICYIQEFVRYLYTGVIRELTFDCAKVLYELGDKYLIKSLVLRSSEYMLDNLSPENACLCLALADVYSDEKLKDSAVNYILEKKVYLQDEHWLPFCNRCPRLANEVYRIIQARSGLEKKPVTSSEKEAPISTMTVLKKSTEVAQSM